MHEGWGGDCLCSSTSFVFFFFCFCEYYFFACLLACFFSFLFLPCFLFLFCDMTGSQHNTCLFVCVCVFVCSLLWQIVSYYYTCRTLFAFLFPSTDLTKCTLSYRMCVCVWLHCSVLIAAPTQSYTHTRTGGETCNLCSYLKEEK